MSCVYVLSLSRLRPDGACGPSGLVFLPTCSSVLGPAVRGTVLYSTALGPFDHQPLAVLVFLFLFSSSPEKEKAAIPFQGSTLESLCGHYCTIPYYT